MQPRLTQVPPSAASSAIATRTPRWPAMRAARTPPLPAPMMNRSKASRVIRRGACCGCGEPHALPSVPIRTIPVALPFADVQTSSPCTPTERIDEDRQVDRDRAAGVPRGARDRRLHAALDLRRRPFGRHRGAAREDLRAGGRSARLAAMVGMEPARSADAHHLQWSAEPARCVAYELYFPDFGTTSTGDIRFVPRGQATRVIWTMYGDMGKNPLYHWMALGANGMVGKDFSEGLGGLKVAAEAP